jgi:hypothetical protein
MSKTSDYIEDKATRAKHLFAPLTKDQIHRQLRAQNVIDLNYGGDNSTVAWSAYVLNEDEYFMALWHSGLGYLEQDEQMKEFMSSPIVRDRVVDILVMRGCCWWTPCGLILWGSRYFYQDNPCIIPVYYMQRCLVWGCFYPCSHCLANCLGSMAIGLAPQTKKSQREDVTAMQKTWNDACKEAEEKLQGKAMDFFSQPNNQGLSAKELILCSRLSIMAYLPIKTAKKSVTYMDFVPFARELNIESRAKEDPSALESLNAFCTNFYSPSDPDEYGRYGHAKPISSALQALGLELIEGFDVKKTDTQGFIAKSKDGHSIFIVFRGTTSGRDWITNFTGSKIPFDPDGSGTPIGNAHSGFYVAFMSALPFITKHVLPIIEKSDGKPINLIITGHSLGAALSTLCTGYFLKKWSTQTQPSNVSLLSCTFGSPKSTDEVLGQFIDSKISGTQVRLFRCHNQKDPVPSTPPLSMGFKHCFKRVVLTPGGAIFFPDDQDAGEKSSDSTSNMLYKVLRSGSSILAFHDPFLYSDATFRFKMRCEEKGIDV